MAKITITKIYRSFQDKQGNPLKTKDGRNFERVAIKAEEYGDKYVSGFGSDWNANWKIGDVVDIKVEQKGQYLNFSRIDVIEELEIRITELEARMFALENQSGKNPEYNPQREEHEPIPANEKGYMPEEEVGIDALPF